MRKAGLLCTSIFVAGALVTLALPATAGASEPLIATEACASGSTCGSGAPSVTPGQSDQPASSLTVQFDNFNFASGDTIALPIEPAGVAQTGSSISTAISYGNAEVTVSGPTTACGSSTAGSSSDANPFPGSSFASLTTNPADSATFKSGPIDDEILLTVGNNATGVPTDCWTVTISNITYNVGSGATAEAVDVAANYNSGATSSALTGSPIENAVVPSTTVGPGTSVGVAEGSTGDSVPGYVLTETTPGTVPATSSGAISDLKPSGGSFTGTAGVSVTGFTVAALTGGGACPASGSSSINVTAPTSGTYAGAYPFCLYGPTTSSTGPGSVTISGITYSAPTSSTGPETYTLTVGSSNYSTSGQPPITVIYNPRIAGISADDTAAVAAESTYGGGAIGGAACSGSGGAVILASDAEYQDALSASFLGYADLPSQVIGSTSSNSHNCASNPILLNPPTPPTGGESTTAAAGAISALGASTVYIIGGTAAMDSDVATQLGEIRIGTVNGSPQYLQVIRIAGLTAEQTASMVATYPTTADGGTAVGTVDQLPATPGAYGMYNSGASESSSGPSSAVPTAILADADEFQDALASSPLAYNDTLPVLLTSSGSLDSNAQSAISTMKIKQVIVVGGSSAVSDTDVAQLQGMGVSVLRIAGTTFDATSTELAGFDLNDYTSGSGAVRDGLDSTANCDATACPSPAITVGTSRGDDFPDALVSSQVLGWSGKTGSAGTFEPLLLNTDTTTVGPATGAFLGDAGTAPGGGLAIYGSSGTVSRTDHIVGVVVFGGTAAQTPGLVQTELDDIAGG